MRKFDRIANTSLETSRAFEATIFVVYILEFLAEYLLEVLLEFLRAYSIGLKILYDERVIIITLISFNIVQ